MWLRTLVAAMRPARYPAIVQIRFPARSGLSPWSTRATLIMSRRSCSRSLVEVAASTGWIETVMARMASKPAITFI